jgi:hypothetical protein
MKLATVRTADGATRAVRVDFFSLFVSGTQGFRGVNGATPTGRRQSLSTPAPPAPRAHRHPDRRTPRHRDALATAWGFVSVAKRPGYAHIDRMARDETLFARMTCYAG